MRHLRCIGGPRHGSVIQMTDGERDVLLVDTKPLLPSPVGPEALDEVSAVVTRLHYTQRTIATAEGRVNYLALAEMTDLQALRIALGPIGIDRSKQLDDLKRTAEAFRDVVAQSCTVNANTSLFVERQRALECALESENYRLDDAS